MQTDEQSNAAEQPQKRKKKYALFFLLAAAALVAAAYTLFTAPDYFLNKNGALKKEPVRVIEIKDIDVPLGVVYGAKGFVVDFFPAENKIIADFNLPVRQRGADLITERRRVEITIAENTQLFDSNIKLGSEEFKKRVKVFGEIYFSGENLLKGGAVKAYALILNPKPTEEINE